MRTETYTRTFYNYNELSEEAKENAKHEILERWHDAETFTEDIKNMLEYHFPESELKVEYSLGYCQGDGLNIYGDVNLYDFLELWEAEAGNKETMETYIDNSLRKYHKSENENRYCYSYTFMDRKYISDFIGEFIDELEYEMTTKKDESIDNELIKTFMYDLLNYFEQLEKQLEKMGYEFFYELSEEEAEEIASCDELEFDENGAIA